MTPKIQSNKNLALNVIEKFKTRGFDGYYCETSAEAVNLISSLIPEGASVTWGGSESLKEAGVFEMLEAGNYQLIDRTKAVTPDERRELYAKQVLSDVFLMSSNAITLDGKLVNIDGNGNRVACMITGPESVIILAGINKIVTDEREAINRVRNIAAPPNAVRLNTDTPCKTLGRCADCLTDACICCHTVITRTARVKGRIKVILVNEELGY